jgi:hypothetical protein
MGNKQELSNRSKNADHILTWTLATKEPISARLPRVNGTCGLRYALTAGVTL